MTLSKRVINIPIGGGLKEAQHEDLFDPPSHAEAVNVTYDDRGALLKRWGSTSLPSLSPSTTTYGNHSTIAEHQGRAVVLTHEKPYVHDEVRSTWTSLGASSPMPSLTKCDPLLRGNNTAIHIDSAVMTYNGKQVLCVVWFDRDLDRVYYVIGEVPDDGRPPQIVYGPTALDSLMNRAPRVVAFGQRFMIIAEDIVNGDLRGCSVNMASSYAASTSVLLHGIDTGIVSDGWDVHASSTYVWTVARTSVSTTRVRRYDGTFTSSASVDITQFKGIASCYHAANDKILIASFVFDGESPEIRVVPSDCSSTGTSVTPAGVTSNVAWWRATVTEAPGGGVYAVWSSVRNLGYETWHVRTNSSYTVTASGWLPGSVTVAGMAAWDGSPREPVVPMADLANPTYSRHGWLCRPVTNDASEYTIRAIAQYGHDLVSTSGCYPSTVYGKPQLTDDRGNMTPSLLYAGGQWLMSYQVLAATAGERDIMSADFLRCLEQDSPALRNVSAQSTRVFGGGTGLTYTDSVNYADVTPPIIGAFTSVTGNDFEANGDYGSTSPIFSDHYYSLAVRWTDESGNIHRSIPIREIMKNALSLTTLVGGLYKATRVCFPRPFPTGITGSKADQAYEVEMYSGTAPGELFFVSLARPAKHPTNPSLDYVVIGPGAVPMYSAYTANLPGYVMFGPANPSAVGPARWSETELTHIQPPAAIDVCSTQDRVWLLSAERGRTDVWPSKLLTRGYAPEFPSSLRVILPNEGGEAVALAALDDKIIVFKERQIYAIFGSPGSNTGTNATLQRPRLVSGDVGCISATSVVEGPYGIVFLAQRGFHLLGRGLELTYIGNDVERTFIPRDNEITSGTLIPDRKQVRWTYNENTLTSDTAKAIVWSYDSDILAFSTFDSVSAVSATTRRGQWIRIAQNGGVYADNTAYTTGDVHSTRVVTAWIKTAGLQGFARIYTALFMFKWFTGYIKIEVGYNHDPDWIDAVQWTNGELASLADPGNGLVQLMVYPTRQKCEAIRFRISEVNPGGQTPPPRGAGHEFVGLSLEVGAKRSNFRKGLGESNKR